MCEGQLKRIVPHHRLALVVGDEGVLLRHEVFELGEDLGAGLPRVFL